MFEDWNGDGRVDSTDEFMEYMMYEEDFGGSSKSSSGSSDGCGCLILAAILVFSIFCQLST